MRRSILAVAVLIAFAVPLTSSGAETTTTPDDPMMGWRPPQVKNEKKDRAEIKKLFDRMEQASMKGDAQAVAALIDFPVLMMTDNSKGEAMGEPWTREQWLEVMEPLYKPNPDIKVKHNPTVFLMTDSLAAVTDVATITVGKGKPMAARSTMLLGRVGGEWKVKAMVEGGWGDMPMDHAGVAEHGTGSGTSTGTAPSASPGDSSTSSPASTPPAGEQSGRMSPGSSGQMSPGTKGQTGETTPPSSGQMAPPREERPSTTK